MPYEQRGREVWHKVDGEWKLKQRCKNAENAKAAIRLLHAKEHNPSFKEKK